MNKNNEIRIPKQNRSIETKIKIIEAAKKLFSDKGYYNTNSKEISNMAGVSIGSFYSYFKDKKELFMEILEDMGHKINQFMKSEKNYEIMHKDRSNTKKIIHEQVKRIFDAHDISPKFHREVSIMRQKDHDVRKILDDQEKKEIKIVLDLFTRFKDIIRIKDLEAAATLVYYSIENIAHNVKFHRIKINENRIINEFTDMLVKYLLD